MRLLAERIVQLLRFSLWWEAMTHSGGVIPDSYLLP
jgi:hypothetical protein